MGHPRVTLKQPQHSDLLPGEQFLPVAGHGGRYLVSNLGRIWSCLSGRIMRQKSIRAGYRSIALWRATGGYDGLYVHRVVAAAFCPGESAECDTVNHKNGSPSDNRAANLEWVTFAGNCLHAFRSGLREPYSKLSKANIAAIREAIRSGERQRVIAGRYGVCQAAISAIKMGKTWSHVA